MATLTFDRREAILLSLGAFGPLVVGAGTSYSQSIISDADVAAAIARIEQSARNAGLVLPPNVTRSPAGANSGNYQSSMPRLVELIEFTSKSNTNIADDAANILGEVNKRERFGKTSASSTGADRSPRPTPSSLESEYRTLFRSCRVNNSKRGLLRWYIGRINSERSRYLSVEKATGAPWYFVGIIHALEASLNFRGHLHNGDVPLTERTRQHPRGRPTSWLPPTDWEASAIDAISGEGFAGKSDWDLVSILYRLEAYNGFGYRRRNIKTPYLWSFSNHYSRGKYVSDGSYNASAVSNQCGAAVILKELNALGYVEI